MGGRPARDGDAVGKSVKVVPPMWKEVLKGSGRALALVQNVAEVARYGGLQTADKPAPYTIIRRGRYNALRRYFPESPADGPPVLLVTSVVMSADVWDVSETSSAARQLHAAGLDPWVVDFGQPDMAEGNLERTLSDSALAVSAAIDEIRTQRGRDVHLAGYSQGGMLCYQVAALRHSAGVASVVSFGGPVDMTKMVPAVVSAEAFARVGEAVGFVAKHVSFPAWFFRNAFRAADPVKTARNQMQFVLALHNRDALLPRENQRRFIEGRGWMTVPGPFMHEFIEQFVAHSRMLQGGIVVDGRTATLADITCPVLAVIGDLDQVAPARTLRPLAAAAPRSETWETHVAAGHLGLVVGSKATKQVWPTVIEWTRWIDQAGPRPDGICRMSEAALQDSPSTGAAATGLGTQLLLDVPAGAARRSVAAAQTLIGLGHDAVAHLPHLMRLQQVKPGTRTSMSRTLDEQAAKDPKHIQFIYKGRAHTRAASKERLDAVVRGLLHIGVHRGDRVGVLMPGRPSAFAAVAALNRIGAVAVLLRPEGEVEREARLGGVDRIVCDPERVNQAMRAQRPVFVLGGGPERPPLPSTVVDLELIDHEDVELPSWYRPNPGRATDVAFVLMRGNGEYTRVNNITNRRWMLSAYGTAAASSLGPKDTVYCLAPAHHASGLLVAMGGAIAAGARFAMTDGFTPDRFWDEVRRYGVTVVVYTWTMLRPLVDAAPHEAEASHPLRLLVGSGMSPALWRRALQRFAPARVVEFYTAPDAEVVLVNLGDQKVGSLGRPLPGSARAEVVAWDVDRSRPQLDEHGMARGCEPGNVGMLLAEVDPQDPSTGHLPALRALFEPEDAWVVTGDLVRRDGDGDYWLVDDASSLIATASGRRSPKAIGDGLEALEEIDLAVAYPSKLEDETVVVAAVLLREEAHAVSSEALSAKIAALAPDERPDIVHIVDEIPITPSFRPTTTGLPGAAEGPNERQIVLQNRDIGGDTAPRH